MLGFIVGTACLIGLIRTLRRGCCGRGGCGYGGCCCCGGGRCSGGRWDEGAALRFMLRPLFERLATTPGQERVILDAAESLRARVKASKESLRVTAVDAAKAFRGERFDEGAMGESFAKQDEALKATQKSMFEALQKVHDALDEKQRRDFAEYIERFTSASGRWGHGPYRA